jgi:hypothetical protein
MPKCLKDKIQKKTCDHIKKSQPILSLSPGIIFGGPCEKYTQGKYRPSDKKLVKE